MIIILPIEDNRKTVCGRDEIRKLDSGGRGTSMTIRLTFAHAENTAAAKASKNTEESRKKS